MVSKKQVAKQMIEMGVIHSNATGENVDTAYVECRLKEDETYDSLGAVKDDSYVVDVIDLLVELEKEEPSGRTVHRRIMQNLMNFCTVKGELKHNDNACAIALDFDKEDIYSINKVRYIVRGEDRFFLMTHGQQIEDTGKVSERIESKLFFMTLREWDRYGLKA